MDIRSVNRAAWDSEVEKHNFWTIPVNAEMIDEARNKRPMLRLTPIRFMPIEWLENTGKRTLVLGGGGGQQAPLLAAYGKDVTLIDISERQIEGDRMVAEREDLKIGTIVADMCDLSRFPDGSFDLVVNPQAINFISEEDLERLYSEVSRVLIKGGVYIVSFANPILYLFDARKLEKGKMKILYTLPFSTENSVTDREREKIVREKGTMEYSHTFTSLVSSLLEKGFLMSGMYTDGSDYEPLDSYIVDCYIALRLVRV